MTREDSALMNAYREVLRCNSRLVESQNILANIASERLGYEVVADICGGGEIEFRRVLDDGVSDADSTIRIEEILQNN